MCRRVFSAACWKPSIMSAQAFGVLGVGVEPPPDMTLPSFQSVMRDGSSATAPRSACVI
jgi:hypothetical protein